MRITILGGNGFIGWHLTKALSKNHFVTVFDKTKNFFFPEIQNVKYIYGNFDDLELLKLSVFDSEVIYHLLSTTVPYTANLNPIGDVQSNLINTLHLLEILKNSQAKKLIFTSSGGTVYGIPNYIPIDENHNNNPISSYGITKLAIEHYVKMYSSLHGFNYLIIRPSNPYGPGQNFNNPQGVISNFLFNVLSKNELQIWGDGEAIRDYIYIDDLIHFLITAGLSELNGTYNIGSGIGHSVNEILREIESQTGIHSIKKHIDMNQYNLKEVILNINKAKSDFNFEISTSLEDGIKKQREWISSLL